jgi:phosphohistidine phosphatase
MKILVIRHAIAEEREHWSYTGRPDTERPLTQDGKRRMRRGVKGLTTLVPRIDLLASSPLVRAVETARIVARSYGEMEIQEVAELAPERASDDLLPWLRAHDPDATVAVVGHEPGLSFLVGWLLTGRHETFVELKKGAAVLLEFDDPPAPGGATLLWAATPGTLRRLAQ